MKESKTEFNQKDYIKQYKKEHYLTFKVDLSRETKIELDSLLKEKDLTKKQFLVNAMEELKQNKRNS